MNLLAYLKNGNIVLVMTTERVEVALGVHDPGDFVITALFLVWILWNHIPATSDNQFALLNLIDAVSSGEDITSVDYGTSTDHLCRVVGIDPKNRHVILELVGVGKVTTKESYLI